MVWGRTTQKIVNSSVYLQDSENPILASKDWHDASQVLWGQARDVIDFVSREIVVLVLAVAVVVVDVTRTDEKVGAGDVPAQATLVNEVKNHTVNQNLVKAAPTWH